MDSSLVFVPPEEDPQYDGEDTRLTSAKELAGWYIYGWAAEVFVICGIGSFIPITLEQLAREMGTLASNRSKPCSSFHTNGNLSSPQYDVTPVRSTQFSTISAASEGQCIIRMFGSDINTASFAMYTFSVSVLIQAILIVSMSAAADHGRYRKTLLLLFAFTGAAATMLFVAIVPQIYMLGAILAIVANTCFGASFVLLNSFLPILVRRHPSLYKPILTATNDESSLDASEACMYNHEHGAHASTDSLLQSTSTQQLASQAQASTSQKSHASHLLTKISSYGIGIGYLAAVIVQIVGIFIVMVFRPSPTSTTLSLRTVLFFIGLWWFVFTIPAALWLRPRPGPPLSLVGLGPESTWRGWIVYIKYAWVALGKTAVRARHLKDVLLFLAAWFLLSDAIATVSGTAVLFAKADLKMEPAALAFISLIGTLTGVIGAFSWRSISHIANLRPSQTVIVCICLFELIPLYGMLGFVPAIQRFGVLGLQKSWEMYPLGAIYGFVLGGLSSYCRGIFGELVPPGSEAAFFALYAITDKGSSVFGPAIVGVITGRYGEIRPAFVFLAVLIFVPVLLMLLVDVERGKRDALRMAERQTSEHANTYVGAVEGDLGSPILES